MENLKHTPGKWEYEKTGKTFVVFPKGLSSDIANIIDRVDKTTEANAKLIAAAPDLLEALIKIYDECKNKQCTIAETAIEAIKKATE